jgi:hypothetical protein
MLESNTAGALNRLRYCIPLLGRERVWVPWDTADAHCMRPRKKTPLGLLQEVLVAFLQLYEVVYGDTRLGFTVPLLHASKSRFGLNVEID